MRTFTSYYIAMSLKSAAAAADCGLEVLNKVNDGNQEYNLLKKTGYHDLSSTDLSAIFTVDLNGADAACANLDFKICKT